MVCNRTYGEKPYKVAVIHGGPGAPGSMRSLAEELSKRFGVIEPFQSKETINGQVEELKNILEEHCHKPIVLIGHSWGAWLSYLFASKYPELVKKIILIGSGAFEAEYLSIMNQKRGNRLSGEENKRVAQLFQQLNDSNLIDKKEVLKEFGELMSKADSYSPIEIKSDALDFQPTVFNQCMKEINILRNNKELLNYGKDIKCPVVAIHGGYDAHPFEGVKAPLSKIIDDFKFILLEKCGHTPWNERFAKDEFYELLFDEINHSDNL